MTETPPLRIPEDRVPHILARAAELDRDRTETVTLDAVRAAALDAGIGVAAVDAALAEYAAAEVPESGAEQAGREQPRFARLRGLVRKAAAALRRPLTLAGGFLVAGLAGAAGEGAVALAGVGWLIAAGYLVWKHRPSRRAWPFALSVVLMTGALGLGFALGEVDEDAIGALFGVAIPVLLSGSLLIKVRRPRRSASSGDALEAATG